MSSEKKDKKRPYTTPIIYELDVDLTQAMGLTQCEDGAIAAGSCNDGTCASPGTDCITGQDASTGCCDGNGFGFVCPMFK